jgi:hypothetical protein
MFKEDRVFRYLRFLSLLTIALAFLLTAVGFCRSFEPYYKDFSWQKLTTDRTLMLESLGTKLLNQAFLVCSASMVYALTVIAQNLTRLAGRVSAPQGTSSPDSGGRRANAA